MPSAQSSRLPRRHRQQGEPLTPTELHGTMFTKHLNRLTKITFRKSRNERKTADCLRSEATSFRSLANDWVVAKERNGEG